MPASGHKCPAVVVMGACGCGKSTVGSLLAQRIAGQFADADDYHSAANVERMRAGIGLTDTDRWPWLATLNRRIHEDSAMNGPLVMACSALRRVYRDRLREGPRRVGFIFLNGSEALLKARLAERSGHYAGGDLVASQLATLEAPQADERALVLAIEAAPTELAEVAAAWVLAEFPGCSSR